MPLWAMSSSRIIAQVTLSCFLTNLSSKYFAKWKTSTFHTSHSWECIETCPVSLWSSWSVVVVCTIGCQIIYHHRKSRAWWAILRDLQTFSRLHLCHSYPYLTLQMIPNGSFPPYLNAEIYASIFSSGLYSEGISASTSGISWLQPVCCWLPNPLLALEYHSQLPWC